jgi:hypothetical protein
VRRLCRNQGGKPHRGERCRRRARQIGAWAFFCAGAGAAGLRAASSFGDRRAAPFPRPRQRRHDRRLLRRQAGGRYLSACDVAPALGAATRQRRDPPYAIRRSRRALGVARGDRRSSWPGPGTPRDGRSRADRQWDSRRDECRLPPADRHGHAGRHRESELSGRRRRLRKLRRRSAGGSGRPRGRRRGAAAASLSPFST